MKGILRHTMADSCFRVDADNAIRGIGTCEASRLLQCTPAETKLDDGLHYSTDRRIAERNDKSLGRARSWI